MSNTGDGAGLTPVDYGPKTADQAETTPPEASDPEVKSRKHAYGDGPVPKQGFFGLFWWALGRWIYAYTGWGWLRHRTYRERWHVASARVWELRHVQIIVAIVNSKGGAGKSMVTAWLVVMHAFLTKRHFIALDANENSGHTAKRLGIKRRDTIQLRRFLRQSTELATLDALTNLVDWDPETGVTVIASDVAKSARIVRKDFRLGLKTAKSCAHGVYCDLGNGMVWASNIESIIAAHTLIFPGLKRSEDSLDDITNTQEQYATMDRLDEHVRNKVDAGIIVIVGARQYERRKFAARFNWPIDRVFVIPPNRYMKKDKPARLSKIPRKQKVGLAEILVAVLEIAQEEQKNQDLSQETARMKPLAAIQSPAFISQASLNGSSTADSLPEGSSS